MFGQFVGPAIAGALTDRELVSGHGHGPTALYIPFRDLYIIEKPELNWLRLKIFKPERQIKS